MRRDCNLCGLPLSIYNSGDACFHHKWDEENEKLLFKAIKKMTTAEKAAELATPQPLATSFTSPGITRAKLDYYGYNGGHFEY